MRKMKKFFALGLILCGIFSGCGTKTIADPAPAEAATENQPVQYQWDFVKKTTGIDDLKKECDEKGDITKVEYETPLYASNPEETVTKEMWVYTPYGYDSEKQYDILYLMHGGGESEIYWLAGERWGPTTRNVLDNMIKNKVCEPFIVVTPTFYPPTEENFENPESAENLTYVFADELRNQIIPTIESQFSTYAGGDVSEEKLIETRDHRAFAGFSMGSMTSIHSSLMKNLDMFSWVGSYSGPKTKVDDFKNALESDEYKDYAVKFWYNGNGKGDIAHDEHDEFCHGAVDAMPDRFVDGENFAWVDIKDGSHAYQSWVVDLYNCMLVFFKE